MAVELDGKVHLPMLGDDGSFCPQDLQLYSGKPCVCGRPLIECLERMMENNVAGKPYCHFLVKTHFSSFFVDYMFLPNTVFF